MKRNFDNLEIGKSYVSKASPIDPVRITRENLCGGTMEASNGSSYSKRGQLFQIGETEYDLITEVTVTITPVEPKKPREYWQVIRKGKIWGCMDNFEEAKILALKHSHVDGLEIVHMRQVMEGEE